MSNAESLEQQIVALGLTAPRITPAQIDALVEQLSFHTSVIPGTTTTLASAINPSGFEIVTASAGCVSPENFNESLGRNHAIAKAKASARNELWRLEGYRLKQNLFEASKAGLIAGLEVYQHEGMPDDVMFVGDLAAGICAAAIKVSLPPLQTSPSSLESAP
ncbi:MAG: Gp49 family protein [Afipia sp.]